MSHYDYLRPGRCIVCGGSEHANGKCPHAPNLPPPDAKPKPRARKARGEIRVGLEEKLRRLNKMYQG